MDSPCRTGLLVEAARPLLADAAQHELDLGITPKARKAEMVAAPEGTLFSVASAGLVLPRLVSRSRASQVLHRV